MLPEAETDKCVILVPAWTGKQLVAASRELVFWDAVLLSVQPRLEGARVCKFPEVFTMSSLGVAG